MDQLQIWTDFELIWTKFELIFNWIWTEFELNSFYIEKFLCVFHCECSFLVTVCCVTVKNDNYNDRHLIKNVSSYILTYPLFLKVHERNWPGRQDGISKTDDFRNTMNQDDVLKGHVSDDQLAAWRHLPVSRYRLPVLWTKQSLKCRWKLMVVFDSPKLFLQCWKLQWFCSAKSFLLSIHSWILNFFSSLAFFQYFLWSELPNYHILTSLLLHILQTLSFKQNLLHLQHHSQNT